MSLLYKVISAPPSAFEPLLNSFVQQGYTPVGNLVAYNDGSPTGSPVLIQLVVLEEE